MYMDDVECNNCEFAGLVSAGAEQCPQCHFKGALTWANEDVQEVSEYRLADDPVLTDNAYSFYDGITLYGDDPYDMGEYD
jgi:hypothetical protein